MTNEEYKGLSKESVKKVIKTLQFEKKCFVSDKTYNKYKAMFDKVPHTSYKFENGFILKVI